MTRISRSFLALLIFCLTGVLLVIPYYEVWRHRPPDFSQYSAGEARKSAFFGYLKPIIDSENALLQSRRARLQRLQSGTWSKRDRLWVEGMAKNYTLAARLTEDSLISTLLEHVDSIPSSLALAQAAKESAWGTSRFAVKGNNYFGQRCYDKGCGLIPGSRRPGERFEVRQFDSVQASVASYMNNINSHREYASLRDYRARQRRLDKPVSGIQAAERMTQYSERRQAYVDELQSLIHFNKLDKVP